MADVRQNGNEGVSELEKKIIRQVEYYFGDQNMPRDKFLLQKVTEDDGWVNLDCLITFNRLKALSTDFDVIKAALKKSSNSLLEIHEDEPKVRRNKANPIPDLNDPFLKRDTQLRTVYIKGFPTTYSLNDVEGFLADKGETVFIKMRRDADKAFKGSVFVEFKLLEDAKKFIDTEGVKVGENDLIKMFRADYYKMKNEEAKQQKASTNDETNTTKEQEEEEEPFELGCVLHFEGTVEGTSREDFKELFGKHEEISWVDYNRSDPEGYLRFKAGGGAQRAVDAVKAENDDKIVVKDAELTVRLLEGIEEKEYWKKCRQAVKNVRDRKRGQKPRGGRKSKFPRKNERRNKDIDVDKKSHLKFDSDDEATGAGEVEVGSKRPFSEDLSTSESKQAKVEE